MDASELSRTAKKPALRATSPSVDYQTIVDGVLKALDLRDRGRTAEVNTVQATNSTATTGNRNKKTPPRQGSPASSNSSVGSFSSRAFSTGRTVRFQDQEDTRSSNQGYGLSAGSRWQGNQSPQGSTNGPRPWVNYRQPGQGTPRPQPPSLGAGWSPRQGGPRFPPPQSGGQWMPGQGGPRLRPPTQGNAGNLRPGWRSSSNDRVGPPPVQQQYSTGRWSQSSTGQQPPATANTPPPRRRGCYVCKQPGYHSDFHGPGAVSPQASPAMGCFVCGQRGCHSSRHEAGDQPPAPSVPSQPTSPAPGPAMSTPNPQSNWQRGSNQGERASPANVPPRP